MRSQRPNRRGDTRKRSSPLWAQRLRADEKGFSLVEEVVAIGLVSLGMLLLVAMVTTGTLGVTVLGDRVTAESLARSQLEVIKNAAYEPDPTANPYPTVSTSAPYSLDVDIEYWVATSESFTTTVTNDGLQRITATVARDGDDVLSLQEYKVDR